MGEYTTANIALNQYNARFKRLNACLEAETDILMFVRSKNTYFDVCRSKTLIFNR